MTKNRISIYKTKAAFKGMILFGGTAAALGLMPLRADILGVSGQNSVPANQPPLILQTPPSDVTNQCVTNQAQWGFNEKQQVTTTQDWSVDGGGKIPKGTTFVNSHMIFMNQPNTVTGSLSQTATWTFDFPIIGVMSDTGGQFEANSTPDFGAAATNYTMPCAGTTNDHVAPFPDRGLEPGSDVYSVTGNTLQLTNTVSQPGDWMRVLTRGENVAVDIKPGSYPNCFNINGDGVVPVAILGSASLNVSSVNTGSLGFNGLQVRVKPNNQNQCSIQDVNGDGIPDLVCQFQDVASNWVQGSTVGVITGTLTDGTPIRGTDSICVVP